MRKFPVIFLILLTGLSCRKEFDIRSERIADEDDGDLCEIMIGTRSGGPYSDYRDTTFRAQLFYRETSFSARLDSLMTPYSGTYCAQGSNSYLTPCAVDTVDWAYDASASPSEGSKYGLRAGRNHNYYLFLSSPAVKYVKYAQMIKKNPADSSKTQQMYYYGLNYIRGNSNPKDHPAVSSAVSVSTCGVTLGGEYFYNFPDTLKEYRSRLAFSVRCGDAIDHCNFYKIELKNLRKRAVYRPFNKDFFFTESSANYESVTVYESPASGGIRIHRDTIPGPSASYQAGVTVSLTSVSDTLHLSDYKDNTYYIYLLSGDYKSRDALNNYVNAPPVLCLTLLTDGGVPIVLDPLSMPFVFEPQKSYYYRITVNSVYVTVSVTVRDWDAAFNINETVTEVPSETVVLTVCDWSTHNSSTSISSGSGSGGGTDASCSTGGVTAGDWSATSGGSSTIN